VAVTEDRPETTTGTDERRRELYEAAPERDGELTSTISLASEELLRRAIGIVLLAVGLVFALETALG
jgi:hypothetical protein